MEQKTEEKTGYEKVLSDAVDALNAVIRSGESMNYQPRVSGNRGVFEAMRWEGARMLTHQWLVEHPEVAEAAKASGRSLFLEANGGMPRVILG